MHAKLLNEPILCTTTTIFGDSILFIGIHYIRACYQISKPVFEPNIKYTLFENIFIALKSFCGH